jgi:DNA-binding NarL/FixJ family response regulator
VVANGDGLLAPTVTRRLITDISRARPTRRQPPGADQLTAREREVWGLVARGMSNPEIAQKLVVGETTVKTHVTRLLAKLDLRTRVQAVVLAYESGLVNPGQSPDDDGGPE